MCGRSRENKEGQRVPLDSSSSEGIVLFQFPCMKLGNNWLLQVADHPFLLRFPARTLGVTLQ